MRHRKSVVKLGRTSSHRKAMFRNMVTSLFKYDRIRTTDAKAKALRGWADHLVTLAKRGDLHARRQALSIIREKDVVHQLFEEAPARYEGISGGYTRVIKVNRRPGDAASMSIIELVRPELGQKKKAKTTPPATEGAPVVEEAVEAAPEATEETASEKTEAVEAAETAPEEVKADAAEEETPEKADVEAAAPEAADAEAKTEEAADSAEKSGSDKPKSE